MISIITGILIGVGLCYVGTLIADLIKVRKFIAWMQAKGIDPWKMDKDSLRAARIAYMVENMPNVSIEVSHNKENDIE